MQGNSRLYWRGPALLASLVASALLITACGGGGAPAPTAQSAAISPAGGAAVTAQTPTNTPATSTPYATGAPPASQLAAQGQIVYSNSCANCHGDQGQGVDAPALWGPQASYSRFSNARQLYDYTRAQMPLTSPGSLSQQQYLEVVTYLLLQNNFVQPGTVVSESNLDSIQTAAATPSPAATSGPGYGPGTGPGYGPGMGHGAPGAGPGMGPGSGPGGFMPGMGPGMMGPGGAPYNQGGSLVTMDQAVQIANQYLSSTGTSNLELTSVHQYTNSYGAEYVEKGTDIHAFEIMIDPYSGAAYPEMGPNVMWNTKYGHLGGVVGGPNPSSATTSMPVSVDTAKANAQQWLNANLQGTTLGSDVDTSYGYYEMEIEKNGQHYGEIDVNGYSGEVWFEDWHGQVVQTRNIQGTGQ